MKDEIIEIGDTVELIDQTGEWEVHKLWTSGSIVIKKLGTKTLFMKLTKIDDVELIRKREK